MSKTSYQARCGAKRALECRVMTCPKQCSTAGPKMFTKKDSPNTLTNEVKLGDVVMSTSEGPLSFTSTLS